ncbi:SLAP domain protein [Lactobacillus helsingborgensis]|uniref:SLAP domain-containing protein n=1 Tax=Lactobacillus helsingborgensis TaxID=1218494 RepID=A0AA47GGR5_9LACO|nr:SLAP domain-containing protein [Lactobacillus helsingborgensis]KJY62979.1 SLAP domain protein [Lactobacillus helsingborgensis]UZX29453.1 SLAP domain-containing protein [Lactobacillus helsingborgensis]
MSKNSFYRKMIVSVAGATLLAVGVNQLPTNALGSAATEVSAAKKATKTKKVGANSAVYKQKGKKLVKTKKIVKVGQKVNVLGKKTVKGKVYYKIGKNQFVKAVNLDGKVVTVAENTVLVTRSGKALKNGKVKKGQELKVFGGTVTIKGKKYYSTLAGYVKVSALAKKETPVDPISNGSTSSTGSNGSAGSTSSTGSNGSAGSTSSTGSNGSTSSNGSNGSAGSNGSTGSDSSNGSAGSGSSNGSTNSSSSASSTAPSKN